MTDRARSRISVNDEDGRQVAAADIEVVDPSEVRASLHVEPGHLPVGTRTRLVDAVLDTPEVNSREHVQVALPLGDTEILDRVGNGATQARCAPPEPPVWSRPTFPATRTSSPATRRPPRREAERRAVRRGGPARRSIPMTRLRVAHDAEPPGDFSPWCRADPSTRVASYRTTRAPRPERWMPPRRAPVAPPGRAEHR